MNYLKRYRKCIDLIKEAVDKVIVQHALPVYNQEYLHQIPNDIIQFTIDGQLLVEIILV